MSIALPVTYTQMRASDIDDVVACYHHIWMSDNSNPYVARVFVMHYLETATFAQVARSNDGTFAGVIIAAINGKPLLFPDAKSEREHIERTLQEQGVHDIYAYLTRAQWLEEDSDIRANTQAELELFMISEQARGVGIGAQLWGRLQDALAQADVAHYFLHTDTSCDFSFYDHHGLERVAQRLHADHPEDDDEPIPFTDDLFIYRGVVHKS